MGVVLLDMYRGETLYKGNVKNCHNAKKKSTIPAERLMICEDTEAPEYIAQYRLERASKRAKKEK